MKQMEAHQKQIGENMFYIRPFPALKAAVVSGDLSSAIGPVFGELGSAIDGIVDGKESIKDIDIKDVEIGRVLPAVGAALSHLNGEQLERLIRELLIDGGNVSVSGEAVKGVVILDLDTLNEVFCGELQDMFELCYEVIKVNFSGFFTKLLTRFGSRIGTTAAKTASASGESSTQIASQI